MNNPFVIETSNEDTFLFLPLGRLAQIWCCVDWNNDDGKPVEVEIGLTKFDSERLLGRVVWQARIWPLPHIWRRWNEKVFGG